ncbi:MAG: hypothetical protein MHPSP_004120, partial [Paramarteilia canceri]
SNDNETQTTVLQLKTEEHISTYLTDVQEHDSESKVMHNVLLAGENSVQIMDPFQFITLTNISMRGQPNEK